MGKFHSFPLLGILGIFYLSTDKGILGILFHSTVSWRCHKQLVTQKSVATMKAILCFFSPLLMEHIVFQLLLEFLTQ